MPRKSLQQPDYHAHFEQADPILFEIIRQVGPFELVTDPNRFQSLVRSIISQQLSTAVARTIRSRLETAVGTGGLTPEAINRLTHPELRALGLSNQKAQYILDLSSKVMDGTVQLSKLGRKSDEEVIEELTLVRGIGRWTAQMFLIFSLGRLDVFPHDDLGVRVAIRDLYGLTELPDKKKSSEIAECWKPYSSVASWYCWRSIELARSKQKREKKPSS
jgi:DNA-3-methyladenine glycosylase II